MLINDSTEPDNLVTIVFFGGVDIENCESIRTRKTLKGLGTIIQENERTDHGKDRNV